MRMFYWFILEIPSYLAIVNQDRDGKVENEELVVLADYKLPEIDGQIYFEFASSSGIERLTWRSR